MPTSWTGTLFPFGSAVAIAPGGSIQTSPANTFVAVPSNGTPVAVVFPTPFASACLFVSVTPDSGVGQAFDWKVTNMTNTGFSIVCEGGDGSNVSFTWMALGL